MFPEAALADSRDKSFPIDRAVSRSRDYDSDSLPDDDRVVTRQDMDEVERHAWEMTALTGIPPPAASLSDSRRLVLATRRERNILRSTNLGPYTSDLEHVAFDEIPTHATLGDRIRSALTNMTDALAAILYLAESCDSNATAEGTLRRSEFEACLSSTFGEFLSSEDVVDYIAICAQRGQSCAFSRVP